MDKQKENGKKNNNIWGLLMQLILGGAIGLIASIYIVDKQQSSGGSTTGIFMILLFLFIAFFTSINIHEFGHFLFGKMFGYSLISYRISFLTWNNENGKMKFLIIKNKGYSGLCAMNPPEQELPNFKIGLFYAGGIILNLLSGLIFQLAAYLFSNFSESANLFFLYMGNIAFILGIVNFIPFIHRNNLSDGKIIWSLILRKPFTKALIELNKITSQLASGTRPRELNITTFEKNDNPQIFELMQIFYFYLKSLDSKDLKGILYYGDLFQKKIECFPNYLLPAIYYELCYIGCITNDQDKAKIYNKKGGKILFNDNDVNGLRVKAYYEYYINKDKRASLILCDKALEVADKFPIKGQGLMEKDLVETLKNLIVTNV